jgi:hypothetical protein
MHTLSPDECDVYSSLVDKCASGLVTVMHNHCMSEQGMIEGFRFTVDPKERSSCIPVCRKMFFRHSMVECLLPKNNEDESVILKLLMKKHEVPFFPVYPLLYQYRGLHKGYVHSVVNF